MAIKRLPLAFPIPDYLERDIQALIDALDNNREFLDCEESEIIGSANMAYMAHEITREQMMQIRDHYAFRGYIDGMD
jgi:hypothetical protein